VSKEAKLRKTTREVAAELVEIQRRLFDVGLVKTAHHINNASKELGWEAEQKLEESFKEKT
jgi:hypothetical protein